MKRRCNVKLSQREGDPTPNLSLGGLQPRNRRSHPYEVEYEDRTIKRRLRFSPESKENLVDSPKDNIQRAQPPLTPFSDHYLSAQSGYYPFCHPSLFYPNTTLHHSDVLNLEAFQEAASMKSSGNVSRDDCMKLPTVQPSVVTLPKNMIIPTATQCRADSASNRDMSKLCLTDHLPNAIFSPPTPSEVSLVAASYLTTPTTMFNSGNHFTSPATVNLYAATGPSPLSALCASLFSPFCDTHSGIHKATQTSGGPKALSILADEAEKMDSWCQANNSDRTE